VSFFETLGGSVHDYQQGPYSEVFDDTELGRTGSWSYGGRRSGIVLQRLDWTDERLES
jgi:hypothetical protein